MLSWPSDGISDVKNGAAVSSSKLPFFHFGDISVETHGGGGKRISSISSRTVVVLLNDAVNGKKVNVRIWIGNRLWIGNPSQSYGASPAIWDHTVLPATRRR